LLPAHPSILCLQKMTNCSRRSFEPSELRSGSPIGPLDVTSPTAEAHPAACSRSQSAPSARRVRYRASRLEAAAAQSGNLEHSCETPRFGDALLRGTRIRSGSEIPSRAHRAVARIHARPPTSATPADLHKRPTAVRRNPPASQEENAWLDHRALGQGIAAEALNLVTEWAFREHDVVRIQLVTHPDNTAYQEVARRCGFEREGILRAREPVKDQQPDVVMYSRLTTDTALPHESE
jgi:Acetyltransferase (GNAT) domain